MMQRDRGGLPANAVRCLLALALLLPFVVSFGAAAADDEAEDRVESLPAPTPLPVSPAAADLTIVFNSATSFWLTAIPEDPAEAYEELSQVAASAAPTAMLGQPTSGGQVSSVLAGVLSEFAAAGHDVPSLSSAVVDLPGSTLGHAAGSTIQIDIDAAGWGWGGGGMDLTTVVRHEVGHALGFGHGGGVMSSSLSAGSSSSSLPAAPVVEPEPEPIVTEPTEPEPI